MKINWDISSETVLECLLEAKGTFESYIEDLNIQVTDEDDQILDSYWNDKKAYKYIKWIDIIEIKAKGIHNSDFLNKLDNLQEYTFLGCIVIMNENIILDGNHRFNTLLSLSREHNINFKVPVLFLYKDF